MLVYRIADLVVVVDVPKVLISSVGAMGPKGEEKQREHREDGGKEGNWRHNEETYRVRSRQKREGREKERDRDSKARTKLWKRLGPRSAPRIGDAGRGKCFLSHNA